MRILYDLCRTVFLLCGDGGQCFHPNIFGKFSMAPQLVIFCLFHLVVLKERCIPKISFLGSLEVVYFLFIFWMAPQFFFLYFIHLVKKRLHTKNQVPRLPGCALKVPGGVGWWVGVFIPIIKS